MFQKISLRNRIYALLAALVIITTAGGLIMVWYTYRIEGLLTTLIDKDVAAFQVAEALETALVNQKGYVSYYFMDNNPDWLRQLGEYRRLFREKLENAFMLEVSAHQRQALVQIEEEYAIYIAAKDEVIQKYTAGDHNARDDLHPLVRKRFFRILELCNKLKSDHYQEIINTKMHTQTQARYLRMVAGSAILFEIVMALLLVLVFFYHILIPVQRLTREADREGISSQPDQLVTGDSGNEINALFRSVRGLIENVDQTHFELEKSREHLLQAEKMALVGKLAAGMAHSIRNPFTSIKMRLFSLRRTLALNDTQQDDFKVISEEMRHIDNIVQNFLEFSRPPRLQMQHISPSLVVDQVVQLLEHRLKSYHVRADVLRRAPLSAVMLDPEQLRECLVNMMINACEAMVRGGTITIRETESFVVSDRCVTIHIRDTGPGIPENLRHKILAPFFTTREEGTGLGLSIADRIIREHGGRLEVSSQEGRGAGFSITLPVKETMAL